MWIEVMVTGVSDARAKRRQCLMQKPAGAGRNSQKMGEARLRFLAEPRESECSGCYRVARPQGLARMRRSCVDERVIIVGLLEGMSRIECAFTDRYSH